MKKIAVMYSHSYLTFWQEYNVNSMIIIKHTWVRFFLWKSKNSGMWHCDVRIVVCEVLRDHSSFILWVQQTIFFDCLTLKMKELCYFETGNYLPNNTASYSMRLWSLTKLLWESQNSHFLSVPVSFPKTETLQASEILQI